MNIENIKQFLGKQIRLVTATRFTYVGHIKSYGDDYIHFEDKYNQIKFISLKFIDFIEEIK